MNERLRHRQALAWTISLACSGGAGAATITVGSPASCDLADAVESANTDASIDGCSAGSGADLILLPADTHYPDFASAPVPRITTDLTIRGHALGTSVLNCEGGGQPFFIGDDVDAPMVVLERFSILSCGYAAGAGGTGAGGAAGMGGAVFVYDGDVTLRSININGSSVAGGLGGSPVVDGGGGAGGGLHGAGGAPGAPSDSLLTLGSGGGGGANASVSSIVPGGAAGAPNGGNGGTGGGFVPLPGAGGFGGGGGGGASLLGNLGGQAGASGGFAGGGGGGGATNSAATSGAIAGRGGDGGFGGGGGRGGSSFNAAAGAGGAGGFGGGGGGRGYSEFGGLPAVGVSGFGAQAAIGGSGGQGAAFGGAVFVRAGTMTLINTGFANDSANGGNAAGFGGAVFVIDQATVDAHNAIEGASRQGMPEVLPEVSGCSVAFSNNSATSQTGDDRNNHDVYGISRAALVEPCKDIFMDGFE